MRRRVLYICIFMKYLRSYKMQMEIPNLPPSLETLAVHLAVHKSSAKNEAPKKKA